MSKVRIKQVRSVINRSGRQKRTMEALGLSRINAVVEKEVTPQITGMIKKVSHLIEVEEVK